MDTIISHEGSDSGIARELQRAASHSQVFTHSDGHSSSAFRDISDWCN